MSINYDSTAVGVPYVRANKITVIWPTTGGIPSAVIEQALAVKLADGSVRELQQMETLTANLDLAAVGESAIPLVHPTTGQTIGSTKLNTVMLQVLAAIRSIQVGANP
jgi:hypothetical protein